jgi:hypothetical protein
MADTPWEPPHAGSEVEHLAGALDRLRTTFRWKADGLDAAGLGQRIGKSSLTIGGLLKHLGLVEDYYFTVKLSPATDAIGHPPHPGRGRLTAPWMRQPPRADSSIVARKAPV